MKICPYKILLIFVFFKLLRRLFRIYLSWLNSLFIIFLLQELLKLLQQVHITWNNNFYALPNIQELIVWECLLAINFLNIISNMGYILVAIIC